MKYRAPKTESMFFQLLLLKNRAHLLIEASAIQKRARDRLISILQKNISFKTASNVAVANRESQTSQENFLWKAKNCWKTIKHCFDDVIFRYLAFQYNHLLKRCSFFFPPPPPPCFSVGCCCCWEDLFLRYCGYFRHASCILDRKAGRPVWKNTLAHKYRS